MTVKYTPGPWAQFNGTDVFTDYPDADGDGWHIADCDVHADEFSNYAPLPTATRTANARLIAAAPDLLEALVWAMRQIDESVIETDAAWAKYDAALAAISKATGADQ